MSATGSKHFGIPTDRLLLQMSKEKILYWCEACNKKAELYMNEYNNSETPNEKLLHLTEEMLNKAKAMENFLERFPDHGPPLLPSTVTKMMEQSGNIGTFSVAKNPFRATHQEAKKESPDWVYAMGPNGMQGYPTKPGEKLVDGAIVDGKKWHSEHPEVLKNAGFNPVPPMEPSVLPPKRKWRCSADGVLEDMAALEKTKSASKEHANDFLKEVLISSTEEEETQDEDSCLPEKGNLPEETSTVDTEPKKGKYNLRTQPKKRKLD